MKKVKRIQRRQRVMPGNRPARVFRVKPDPDRPFVVEVRIAHSRRAMRAEMDRLEGQRLGLETAGLVRSWSSRIDGRAVIRPRGMVARMYLNVTDLRRRPSEIVSHECTHAGMAWARLQHANLARMAGEEVLCYAVGRLVSQVNRVCFASGVF